MNFIVTIVMILLVDFFSKKITRKRMGLAKGKWRRAFYTKYEGFMNFFILIIFVFSSTMIDYESIWAYVLLISFLIVLIGFEAFMNKRYDKEPKEYLVTLISGSIVTIFVILSFSLSLYFNM